MNNENNYGSVLLAFLAGSALGLAAGVLFAPKSGKESRDEISGKAMELAHQVKEAAGKASQSALEAVEFSKTALKKEANAALLAVEAGKKAFQENKV